MVLSKNEYILLKDSSNPFPYLKTLLLTRNNTKIYIKVLGNKETAKISCQYTETTHNESSF